MPRNWMDELNSRMMRHLEILGLIFEPITRDIMPVIQRALCDVRCELIDDSHAWLEHKTVVPWVS